MSNQLFSRHHLKFTRWLTGQQVTMSDTPHLHRESEHSYHQAIFTQPVSGYEYDTRHHSLRKRSHTLRYATLGVSGLAVVSLVWWLNNSDAFYAQDNHNLSLQENIANKLAQLPQSLGQSITSPSQSETPTAENVTTAGTASWSSWLHLNVKPGDTLLVIFERNHLNTDDMYQILEVADYADNLHSLYPGQEIRVKRDAHDGIDELSVALDLNTELHIFKNDAGFGGEIMQFNEHSGRMQVVTDSKILAQYGGDDVEEPETQVTQVEAPAVIPPAKVVAKAPVKLTAQEVAKINKEVKIAAQAAAKTAKITKESKESKERSKIAAKEAAKEARAKAIAEATAKKAARVAAAEEAAAKKAAQTQEANAKKAAQAQEANAKKAARLAQRREDRKQLVASMREVSRHTAAPVVQKREAPVREVIAAIEPRRAVRQEVASTVASVRQSFAQLSPRAALPIPSPAIEPVRAAPRRKTNSSVGTTVFDDVDSQYSTSSDPKLSRVVDGARGLLGTPYRFGGTTPKGFDCSGLVRYTAQKAGVNLPRTAREQYSATKAVGKEELKPGDLVFFNTRGRGVGHVGIYVGDNKFIHAPNRRKDVQVTSLNNKYYKQRYIRGGRL